ncbi:hypothetical protein MAR_025777 [Mya arenaria]|uniref:Uncharacterized protein n=1 Tax=Mya arenaria TaxID=6604 RepID=A0ABY7ER50_MYAAR|nr:hypothetical protein MAR_025777 [Mya arenaria]
MLCELKYWGVASQNTVWHLGKRQWLLSQKFQGYNQYSKLRHRPPQVTSEKLHEICTDLADVIQLPSMCSKRSNTLKIHMENLASVLVKLQSNKKLKAKCCVDSVAPSSHCYKNETSCHVIPPTKNVEDMYTDLEDFLSLHHDYEYLDLDVDIPTDRFMKLSKPVMLYGVAIGEVWELSIVFGQFLLIHLRQELKRTTDAEGFHKPVCKLCKMPKSVLRNMFFDLTGCELTAETSEQREINDRAAENLIGSDDTTLLLDLRSMNDNDTKYDEFYDAVGNPREKKMRRVIHVIENVHRKIKGRSEKRVPEGVAVPSAEALRLQFTPSNQFSKTALRFTSRFNVKFRVHTRMARVSHPDAHYVAAYNKYLKHFCVAFKEHTHFVCLDDKSIVPIGEPGIPISKGVRGHNKVMTPGTGLKLVAADHDFHIAGVIPSVVLVTEIPDCADDSFFQGNVFVTCKDKSPDHRLTYESVKVLLLEIFFALDLDCLVVLRTAPNHSWMNPAERCMSILNLALQHVSLCREDMDEEIEKYVKREILIGRC